MSVTFVTVLLIAVIMVSVFILTIISVVTMALLVAGNIFVFIPLVMDKIHPLSACIVFVTVFAPVFGMPRRYAQIDGVFVNPYSTIYDNRLRIDESGSRIITDVKTTVKTGLTDADGNTHVGCECEC